jgi:hypothetical protein
MEIILMSISAQIIAFNAESVLPKNMMTLCIESIMPFVDKIFIVEGATKATTHYFDGNTDSFTKDGRSTDGTIDVLLALEKKYPDKIDVTIGNGFFNGKTKMCNTALSKNKSDYVWQIDLDEFYKPEDMKKIIKILDTDRPDAIEFFAKHFWGGFDYCIDERELGWGNDSFWRRIFRVNSSSHWLKHEPPTMITDGNNCSSGKVITRDRMLQEGIFMYHYSYVHYPQVDFKTKFYGNPQYPVFWESFKQDKSTKVFGSNVYKFEGQHPNIIKDFYGV